MDLLGVRSVHGKVRESGSFRLGGPGEHGSRRALVLGQHRTPVTRIRSGKLSQVHVLSTPSRGKGRGTPKSSVGKWSAFNTGLVDRLYDPVFALFQENDPKRFETVEVLRVLRYPGGPAGKQLTSGVRSIARAQHLVLREQFDMLLDTSKDIHVDYDHVILDGVSRDRFPPGFLEDSPPKKFLWRDYTTLERNDREQFLTELAQAIQADVQTMRGIKRRLEDAKLLERSVQGGITRRRFLSTFPRQDVMSLLLPLAIVDDEKVDLALVVTATCPAHIRAGRCFHWIGLTKTRGSSAGLTAIGLSRIESPLHRWFNHLRQMRRAGQHPHGAPALGPFARVPTGARRVDR